MDQRIKSGPATTLSEGSFSVDQLDCESTLSGESSSLIVLVAGP